MKSIIDKIIDQIEEYKVDIMDLAIKERLVDFSVEKMKQIIIEYKIKPKQGKKQNLIAITNGNPYVTVILIMQSIISESKITIYNQGNLNKLNQKIIDIISGEIDIKLEPTLETKLEIDDLEEYVKPNKKTKILVIDDVQKTEILKTMGLSAQNIQILSINLYVDTDELNSIKEAMINYCNKNYIKMKLLKTTEITLQSIKEDLENYPCNIILILTKNEGRYKNLQENLKNKKIYININPFDSIEQEIATQIIDF